MWNLKERFSATKNVPRSLFLGILHQEKWVLHDRGLKQPPFKIYKSLKRLCVDSYPLRMHRVNTASRDTLHVYP